jgi:hypothetical protein
VASKKTGPEGVWATARIGIKEEEEEEDGSDGIVAIE